MKNYSLQATNLTRENVISVKLYHSLLKVRLFNNHCHEGSDTSSQGCRDHLRHVNQFSENVELE